MYKNVNDLTDEDKLELFFANFTNRDNEIFDKEKPNVNDMQQDVILKEENFKQDENVLSKTLTETINKKAEDEKIDFDEFSNKNKQELIDIIDKTLKTINEANQENDMKSVYFDSIQKAIDFKIYEQDKELMKQNLKNMRKSKASQVIDDSKKEIDEI